MKKESILLALTNALVHAQSYLFQQSSSVCVENYTTEDILWQMQDSSFAFVSSQVTTSAGTSTCENLSNFITGGAQQDMDYEVNMKYKGAQYTQIYEGMPYITYSSSASSISYACGITFESLFCCCEPGNKLYFCVWSDQ